MAAERNYVDEDFRTAARKHNEELRDQERRFHATGLESGINRSGQAGETERATRERTIDERIGEWIIFHLNQAERLKDLRGSLSTNYLQSGVSRLGIEGTIGTQKPPY